MAATRALPTFDELPAYKNFKGCAWSVWGEGDQLGTVNLLTPEVVSEAAKEIRTGKAICLNLPLNFEPAKAFGRRALEHTIIPLFPDAANDDILSFNTQASSQWDGLKHCGVVEHKTFYNGVPGQSFKMGNQNITSATGIEPDDIKLGIHNWAQHGICGRGVLLDMVKYYTDTLGELPYDPFTAHPIPLADLLACAKAQGVEFRQADILLVRAGFLVRYNSATQEERDALKPTFAGVEQGEHVARFLWDTHFAAVATDMSSFERWPALEGVRRLHDTMIALWGMPIGEFFDLEALSKQCSETGRYTFFFSSWPLNVLGGVASPPNAAAYF